MRKYESFDPNPPNSPRNVSDVVEAKFCVDKGMPTLLKELIVLLGNEKEEWGGVKTMRACVDEFFTWKNGIPKQKDKVSTAKDLEEYLFAVDRHILVHVSDRPNIIKATTRQNLKTLKGQDRPSASNSVVDPPADGTTIKRQDRPSASKSVVDPLVDGKTIKKQDPPSASKSVVDPPTDGKTIKRQDSPNPSKSVVDPPVDGKTIKKQDPPSASKSVVDLPTDGKTIKPPNPKSLKVKIYMGTGWEIDFTKLHGGSPPHPYVNLTINDGKSQETKVRKSTRTPCWGEEFEFPLTNLKDAKLNVRVFYHSYKLSSKKFAGEFSRLVSVLKKGLNVIPLSYEEGKRPCSSAWLLVRFMFV